MTDRLTIRRPDDWHVHLRDGAMLDHVAPYTARQFARAIVMPNLSPPVTTAEEGAAYRQRILAAVPEGLDFTPLIVAYLTDSSSPAEIARGHAEGVFTAAKLYPAHATTGSAHGVTDIAKIRHVLEKMQEIGMPLLIHGEVTDHDVDIFDREAVFIERTLIPLVRDMPEVQECYSVTGDFDYVIKVVARDLKALSALLMDRLMRLPGVNSVRSSICLDEVKCTAALPLD